MINLKILYLYNEVMGYTMSTIKELVKLGGEVHVVYRDKKKLTPYLPPKMKNVFYYPRSLQSKKSLLHIAKKVKPNITVVSGWIDKDYLYISKILRERGLIVVCGLDGQWLNSFKQKIANVLGKFGFFTNYFSHMWVAGIHQYEYAKKIGFKKEKIIFNLYSSDLSNFSRDIKIRKNKYPHSFLFIGRYESVKGIDVLLESWKLLESEHKDWKLQLIGNGSLKTRIKKRPDVIIKDFMQPKKLSKEISKAGCFVLPSLYEPWGVVVHEMAAAGLPLILSKKVGSASTFLIDGYNGYSFKQNDPYALSLCMKKIINTPDEILQSMSLASQSLSGRITPESSAYNLMSTNKLHDY